VNISSGVAVVNNSASGSMFTGLAITSHPSGNFLYAAANANNMVDVYDETFTLVNSFTDTTLPAGFAPFGIQHINGLVWRPRISGR
jgi:DNA-binding beta-propeller fold protein YncE